MLNRNHCETRRRGAIAPLSCLLIPILVGMAAFAVDISLIATSQSELQNTADAAALAGVGKLGTNFVTYNLPTQTAPTKAALLTAGVTSAKAAAKAYASYNAAGGVSNLSLLDADIDVGFTSAAGVFTSTTTNTNNYPNTVKVKMRRDATANGSLGLYFARILGCNTMDQAASATAVAYGGTIDGFNTGPAKSRVLPMTYDVDHWDNFVATGLDPDSVLNRDASGNPVLQVYPSIKATGNFGMLSLDDSHNGASEIRNWIDNGMASSDIQALKAANQIPLSSRANAWDWSGNPGLKASDIMAVNANIGETYLLPLYRAKDSNLASYAAGVGNGSHYDYNIVRFVGVKIMPASNTNKEVIIQPYAVSDPNELLSLSTVVPLGTGAGFVTVMAPSKLTQ